MRLFSTLLWKEWRDHRAVIFGFLAAVPVVVGLAAWALPDGFLRDEWFVWGATLGCFGIALLSLVTDVVPGEERRGRLGFLRRLPHGLGTVFCAKVAFVAAVLAGFTAYGYLVGGLLGNAGFPAPGEPWRMFWVGLPCVAAWAFVCSCWLPRGALSLPATVLVLGVFGLPVFLAYHLNPGLKPFPRDVVAFQWLLFLGALPVAWLSFARGRLFGRGVWSAAWRGLLLTGVVFSPAWAFAASEARDWRALDPASPRFRLTEAFVSPDGKAAYVNAQMRRSRHSVLYPMRSSPPTHALVVELATGRAARRGDLGDRIFKPRGLAVRQTVSVLGMEDISARDGGSQWVHYFDARTGKRIKSGWWHMVHPEVERRLGVAGVPAACSRAGPAGLGWLVYTSDGDLKVYDPFRRKLFDTGPWPWTPFRCVLVRPGRWLVKSRKDRPASHRTPFRLWDPERDALSEPLDFWSIGGLLDDGRVLRLLDGRLFVVDPETDEREETTLRAAGVAIVGRTPTGRYVLRVRGDTAYRYARFDPATLEVRFANVPPVDHLNFTFCGATDEAWIGILNERQLVRVGFGDEAPVVLFPR